MPSFVRFANGGVGYTEKLDTDGNHTLDTTFNRIMATAEAVRLNPASTARQLQQQRDILVRVNGRSRGTHA